MRSLYSGVAGLKTHQTKMDVIGNNIANVNTMGFKSSSVLFRDVLYQTTSVATGATSTTGGTNSSQIGLGTKVSSISTNITENGAAQSTNNPYDLMLNGDSFFVVSRGGTNYFTKVGSFEIDGSGCLVTSNGYQVMGWQVDPDNPNDVKKDVVSALYPEKTSNKVSSPEQTSQAYLNGNIDYTDSDLTSVDGSVLSLPIYDASGYSYTCKFKLTKDDTVEDNSAYYLEILSVKDSNNVEILGEDDPDTAAVTEGGYTASFNKVSYTSDGSIPSNNRIKITMNPKDGSFVSVGVEDATAEELEKYPDYYSQAVLTLTPNNTSNADVFSSYVNGEKVEGITIDFSNLTLYQSGGESTAAAVRGSTASEGGGRAMGKMSDVSIDTSGKIYGVYSNGETKLLGQIAVANFTNPTALEAIGNSMYTTTQNSGEFDGVGTTVDEDGGSMAQGVLEMSNVDLSTEFTEMITTQRGFQANSRIITTSDSMLEELVNLKR
jgi:flagellar hook protein FlgE